MGDYSQENSLNILSPTNTCVPELNCNPYVLQFSNLKKWMFCPKDGWNWTWDDTLWHWRTREGVHDSKRIDFAQQHCRPQQYKGRMREEAGTLWSREKQPMCLRIFPPAIPSTYWTAEWDPLKRSKVDIKRIHPEQQLLWPWRHHVMMLFNCLFSSFQNKMQLTFSLWFQTPKENKSKNKNGDDLDFLTILMLLFKMMPQ